MPVLINVFLSVLLCAGLFTLNVLREPPATMLCETWQYTYNKLCHPCAFRNGCFQCDPISALCVACPSDGIPYEIGCLTPAYNTVCNITGCDNCLDGCGACGTTCDHSTNTTIIGLDLSGMNLASVPPGIESLIEAGLASLNLDNNRLTTLPPWLGNLTNISVDGNNLWCADLALTGPNAAYITSQCEQETQHYDAPEVVALCDLAAVTNCSDNCSRLCGICGSTCVYDNYHVTRLQLDNKGLTALPSSFGNFLEIEYLNLSFNNFAAIPVSICQLTELVTLDLQNNLLTGLPDCIGNISTLRNLYINNQIVPPESPGRGERPARDNAFTHLPPELCLLTQLEILAVHANVLTDLPACMGNMTGLKWINAGANSISALPSSFGSLGALTYLNLFDNRLNTHLPSSICNFTLLEYFDVQYNNVLGLPACIGNMGKLSLTTMYMAHNNMTAIPDSIGDLTTLTYLSVSNNKVTVLPESVGSLIRLTTLRAVSNKLGSIPSAVGNLTAVRILDLADNQITVLPDTIGICLLCRISRSTQTT